MTESQTAFELLLDIDRRCRLLAADLPSQETRLQRWSGIAFRVGSNAYVAPMGEVAEVLHEPRCTLMPGVKPWVKGVANLRGRLLPVMDLGGFLGLELSKASSAATRCGRSSALSPWPRPRAFWMLPHEHRHARQTAGSLP